MRPGLGVCVVGGVRPFVIGFCSAAAANICCQAGTEHSRSTAFTGHRHPQ